MKASMIVLSALFFLGCTEQKAPDPQIIYDEALEQLFKEKYYNLFVDLADDTVHIDSLFLGGHIDREEYDEFVFGLRDKGISSSKTLHVDYINSLLPQYRDAETLSSYLKDPFIEEHLKGIPLKK